MLDFNFFELSYPQLSLPPPHSGQKRVYVDTTMQNAV